VVLNPLTNGGIASQSEVRRGESEKKLPGRGKKRARRKRRNRLGPKQTTPRGGNGTRKEGRGEENKQGTISKPGGV